MSETNKGTAKVISIVGTRPEIIKVAPVIREIQDSAALDSYLLHTGQHYDDELSTVFFQALDLPTPDKFLNVGSGTHSQQTAEGLSKIGQTLQEEDPAAVLAQGDTNSVLSAALAASKRPVTFGHIEAGLRSFDQSMPEEVNRTVADHVSDLRFAPTETAVQNLATEGIQDGVYLTGNTIVDACHRHADSDIGQSEILDRLEVTESEYILATIHRPRNTDNTQRLTDTIVALNDAPYPVILPIHPRTEAALEDVSITPSENLRIVDPLHYIDFLQLLVNTRAIVTDSGGIQEEAAVFEIPCITVRPTTERPETVEAGINQLVEPNELDDELSRIRTGNLQPDVRTANLYGDGSAGEQITEILLEQLDT